LRPQNKSEIIGCRDPMPATDMTILKLEGPPLAGGGFREIYQHPECEEMLVKVLRPAVIQRGAKGPAWLGALRRYGVYTPYVREVREYLAVHARFQTCPPILQKCYGFIDTDRGLGLVVEKLRGRDGGLAPNVAAIVKSEGISRRLWNLCEAFYEEVRRHNLVIGDLNPRNIVWAVDAGADRLALVDGLGEKTLIPLRSLSAAYNRYQTARGIRRSQLRIMQHAAGLYRPGRISRAMARRLKLEELIDRPPARTNTI
jgi:hypothetical protein